MEQGPSQLQQCVQCRCFIDLMVDIAEKSLRLNPPLCAHLQEAYSLSDIKSGDFTCFSCFLDSCGVGEADSVCMGCFKHQCLVCQSVLRKCGRCSFEFLCQSCTSCSQCTQFDDDEIYQNPEAYYDFVHLD